MTDNIDDYIAELEAKNQILEQENEALSMKAEENLLLSRSFETIGEFEDVSKIQADTVESICVLFDVPFCGIFNFEDSHFQCKHSYAFFTDDEFSDVELKVSSDALLKFWNNHIGQYDSHDLKLGFEGINQAFHPIRFIVSRFDIESLKNRILVIATDDVDSDLVKRMPLIEKVIQVVSSRIERITFHVRLQELNLELESAVKDLRDSNHELQKKHFIIETQNRELESMMNHLKATQSQLVQSEKLASLGILTAGVAHEINNPLNYVMGGYLGLEDYFEENPTDEEDVPFLLSSIKKGVDQAATIVTCLNQFSRSSDDDCERCDIHNIIRNCILVIQSQVEGRVTINCDCIAQPIILNGNVGKLHQVLSNILMNSIQAIEALGSISIQTRLEGEHVRIDIQDNGCGIDEAHLCKLTDPFFTMQDPGMGAGLGLSIANRIILDHQGTLSFKSELGVGTTVIIRLPYNIEKNLDK